MKQQKQNIFKIYFILLVAIGMGCQDNQSKEFDLVLPSDVPTQNLPSDTFAESTDTEMSVDVSTETTEINDSTDSTASDTSVPPDSPDPPLSCAGDAYEEYLRLYLCTNLDQHYKMRLGGPCQSNDDCESQLCYHHPSVEGEGFCTVTCINDVDCLPGWACPVQDTPPDICTCTPRPEVCDRLDNDCNGLVDDGRPTELGCGPAERCENARCVCNAPLQPDGSCTCQSDADCPLICSNGQCATAVALDVGVDQRACAVLSDGSVWCWQTLLEQPNRYPVRVEGVRDAVDVVLSHHITCVLDLHGLVWCWGSDSVPVQVPNISNIAKISVFNSYFNPKFCALSVDNSVWCWGQYPFISFESFLRSYQIHEIHDVIDLAHGITALKSDNSVWIWSDSVWIEIFSSEWGIRQIRHMPFLCGLSENHTVLCSSKNYSAEWGFDICPFLDSVKEWSYNNCILFRDQTVLCRDQQDWFCDGYISKTRPYIVPQRTGVERVPSENGLACVLLSNGEIDCWLRDAPGFQFPPETPMPLIWPGKPPQP